MKLWNKLAQDTRVIAILVGANILQFFVILGLIFCLATIPTRFTFHIPPDLSNGATLKANKVPNAYVGEFAFYMWQAINNWPTNGAQDSSKNLNYYGAYLTPSFKYYLQQHYKKLHQSGQLQGRVRVIRPIPGDQPKVTRLTQNSWQVLLKVRESAYVNGILVKDKNIEFPFKVVRFNEDAQLNPFGLALDGFTSSPILLKLMK